MGSGVTMANLANETTEPKKPVTARSHWFPIAIIALIARVIEICMFFGFSAIPPLRTWGVEMIATAISLQSGHGYSSPFFSPTGPTAFAAPGYVLLMASVISVFGTGTAAATVLVALQVMFALVTLWLVMYTARLHFGPHAANIAGLLYALYPSMIVAPVKIGDATLSTLFVAAFFAGATTLYLARAKFIPAGVGCAIAGLVNPALIPMFWGLCGWAAWKAKRIPWMGVLAFMVVFSPWPIRNAVKMHAFIPFRSDFGYELNIGNHEGGDGNFVQSMNPMMVAEERRDFVEKGEVRYLSEKGALAKSYILSHKGRFAELCFKRFIQFWAGIEEDGAPTTIPLLIFAASGLWLLRKDRSLLALYAIPFLVYPLPYYLTHVSMRFQYMIDPLLTVLGAGAISALLGPSKDDRGITIGHLVPQPSKSR